MISAAGSREAAGIYVHVPFCSAICPYCDFAVQTGRAEARARFVDSLLLEIRDHDGFPELCDTIYFGGGTPSLLSPGQLARIIAGLRDRFDLSAKAWLLFEVNPEDVDIASLAAWRGLGVNTISLGVQSFSAADLRFLGRRHTPAEARRSVELAREAGFETVSLDLIYGLPEQTLTDWERQLATAIELDPDHLSCYQLTVANGTPFARRRDQGRLVELPTDLQGDFFRATHDRLRAAGYDGYELSNFARAPEHRSRHNQKYWRHTPYLGLGPAAHSFLGRARWWNVRGLTDYEARVRRGESPVEGREELRPAQLALELVMLRLRTREGIDLAELWRRYGVDLLQRNREVVERGVDQGQMMITDTHLSLTPEGLAIADGIAAQLDVGE